MNATPPENNLQIRLDRAMRLKYRILHDRSDRNVYCWRRYLQRLKGFRTVDLGLFLANLELFSEHVAVVDPSSALGNGPCPGKRLIVAHRDFALKCLVLGLPDINSMRFKKPTRWDWHDQMGLEFKLPQRLP